MDSLPIPTVSFVPRNDRSAINTRLDLICFSHLRWQFVTQRPQHLLTRAALDRRVFFWEEPMWHPEGVVAQHKDGSSGMRIEILTQGPTLWVIQPHLTYDMDPDSSQRELLTQFLKSFHVSNYMLWYYTPMAMGFTDQLSPRTTVYDCMDELSAFLNAPPELIQHEQHLFEKADVVFTGGLSLYEAKRLQHPNVHAFPSSIDAAHFSQSPTGQQSTGSKQEPFDQRSIAHPRAGFYGVIDERFDVALLGEIARLRPHVQFIILGPVVKISPSVLPQADNIHYLGGKTYDELPAYLAGWDVALLPFALNDSTRFISPTKTPEYLAAGKPVVSTPIRDVVRGYGDAGLVAIAATPETFAAAIDKALLPPTKEWQKAVTVKLAESSWDSTWAGMQRELDTVHLKPSLKQRLTPYFPQDVFEKPAPLARPNALEQRIRSSSASLRTATTDPLHGSAPNSLKLRSPERFDYLVVGAGFAGGVLAERLASQPGQRVLVVDKRDHIAGNAYDFLNEDGILIHKYGPHIFHTNSEKVLAYLSRFTQWRQYEHRVLSSVDGKLLPVPINLDTINRLFELNLDAEGMKAFLAERAENIPNIRTSEDIVVSRVGRELYEKFFRNYTRKQWGLDPSQLDSSVAARIPLRFDRDDRYFSDSFQVMPLKGYTHMFERLLDHPRITVRTGVDYKDIARSYPDAKVIYTGPIDEYFDFRFGPLPYRSLEFKHETHNCELYQPAAVVNYPNEHAYTRVTEFKYLTGQKHSKTSIVYEYPRAQGDPYYPIPRPENAALYARYKELADASENVYFCGRLANYRYLNMDQVVGQALATFQKIAERQTITMPPLVVGASPLTTSRVPSE